MRLSLSASESFELGMGMPTTCTGATRGGITMPYSNTGPVALTGHESGAFQGAAKPSFCGLKIALQSDYWRLTCSGFPGAVQLPRAETPSSKNLLNVS